MDDDNQPHNPVNRFSIDKLNAMVYKSNSEGDIYDRHISCNYIQPIELRNKINPKHMSVMSYNIRSMFQNFTNFKTEILSPGTTLDIIGLCEAHLTDATEGLYKLDHYNFFSTNISSNKGGVCIYIRNDIKSKERPDITLSGLGGLIN